MSDRAEIFAAWSKPRTDKDNTPYPADVALGARLRAAMATPLDGSIWHDAKRVLGGSK